MKVEGKGFSLIEILIVLCVLGILAIVFTTQMKKKQRNCHLVWQRTEKG